MIRDEILRDAVEGHKAVPEWVAMQTVRLYQEQVAAGLSDADALATAQREMIGIMNEALEIRRARKQRLKTDLAAWFVVAIGVLACVGWYLLWE